jgi:hypothetical protein
MENQHKYLAQLWPRLFGNPDIAYNCTGHTSLCKQNILGTGLLGKSPARLSCKFVQAALPNQTEMFEVSHVTSYYTMSLPKPESVFTYGILAEKVGCNIL